MIFLTEVSAMKLKIPGNWRCLISLGQEASAPGEAPVGGRASGEGGAAEGKPERTGTERFLEILVALVGSGGGVSILISNLATKGASLFLWDCGVALTVSLAGLTFWLSETGRKHRRTRLAVLAVVIVALASIPVTGIFQELNPGSACTRVGTVEQVGGHSDPRVDVLGQEAYFCPTSGVAAIYQNPGSTVVTGGLNSGSFAWMVCWMDGPGVAAWYYTEGDLSTPGHKNLNAWGVIPSTEFTSADQPDPGVPKCGLDIVMAIQGT
jgi:hypothetical protein